MDQQILDTRREEFLWFERYRPRKLDDCIIPENLKTTFKEFLKQGGLPNLLFHGGAGVGKTSTARALCEELNADYYIINGSLEGGIDTLRTDIADYASSVSVLGGRKYLILDEADYLTPATQPALRAFMEDYSKNCGFILACNYLQRIIEPLHSRCAVIDFAPSQAELPFLMTQFYKRVAAILAQENVQFDRAVVGKFISQQFPDMRRILNELQVYAAKGKIDAGILAKSQTDIAPLIPMMKGKDFTRVRQWLAQNPTDTASLIKEFDKRAYEFFQPSSIPVLEMSLNEMDFKAAFVACPEVNQSAHLAAIMARCVFK